MAKLLSPNKDDASARHISPLKVAIYAIGTLCFILSVVYVSSTVAANWSSVTSADWEGDLGRWLPLVVISYAAAHFATALAWPTILSRFGQHLPAKTALHIGLLAQVGKYLPGNVAHYFGRAALAKRSNIDFSISGLSILVELGAAAIAAFLVATTCLIFSPVMQNSLLSVLPDQLFFNPTIITIGALAIGTMILARSQRGTALHKLLNPSLWIAPVGWLLCSILLVSFSFYALGMAISDAPDFGLAAAMGIYATAWVTGLLIPGAPAGLGVREAVLLGFLSPIMGPSNAVLLALAHRLITAITDGIVAAVAALFYFKAGART